MVKVIADFRILFQKAHALGQAKLTGNKETVAKAQADHDTYQRICLAADELTTGLTYGTIEGRAI